MEVREHLIHKQEAQRYSMCNSETDSKATDNNGITDRNTKALRGLFLGLICTNRTGTFSETGMINEAVFTAGLIGEG